MHFVVNQAIMRSLERNGGQKQSTDFEETQRGI